MFFRKKEHLQQLNLETPKPGLAPPSAATAATDSIPLSNSEAVNRRAKEILDSGRIPDWLYVCASRNGLLMYQPAPDQKPMMLLFSSAFAANDYLRATGTQGTAHQFKVDTLPESAQSWLSFGVQAAVLDRCPRCPQCVSFELAVLAKLSKEDFARLWAHLRATRLVMGEMRVRSAMSHLSAGSHAAARNDLEYIRDHFDSGIPYLHQVIGLLAGMQKDEPARASAIERLKEFGPQFDEPLDFSPELVAKAMVGLMANFGMLRSDAM